MDGGIIHSAYSGIHLQNSANDRAKSGVGVRIKLAESPDEFAMALAVRASVFLAEPGCRFRDEFDANEYVCAHVLVWVGDEPVGTLRLRWFAAFARFERMAIRPEYRSLKVFRALVRFAMALCAAKGYRHVIGLSREPGVKFWKRFGGRVVGDPIEYHGEILYPMCYELPAATFPAIAPGMLGAGNPTFEQALGLPETELAA